jgi:hypothetical protein
MKSCLIPGAVFLLTYCVAWADDRPKAPIEVSYCQLAKDPSAWVGKRMHVRAIYHYGFEFYRLESPICCEESATKIWVQADTLDDRSERLFRKLDRDGVGTSRLRREIRCQQRSHGGEIPSYCRPDCESRKDGEGPPFRGSRLGTKELPTALT